MSGQTRRKILFGLQPEWEPDIRGALDAARYECQFGDLLLQDFAPFDAVVPLTLEDYWGLNEFHDAARGKALFPSPDAVSLCHDKYRFNRFVADSALSALIPPMVEGAAAPMPFILKRKEDQFGADSYLIRSQMDADQMWRMIQDPEFFCQSYVAGDHEYTTHLLLRDGQVRFHQNVVYDMGAEFYVKSTRYKQQADSFNQNGEFVALFAELARLIGFTDGTCCVNYKLVAGRPLVFEVNPRFGGSLHRTINAYLDAYLDAVR